MKWTVFRYVYEWAMKNDLLSHDSYDCDYFAEKSLPFPNQRKAGHCNYAGCIAMGNVEKFTYLNLEDEAFSTCKEMCRKEPDWLFC